MQAFSLKLYIHAHTSTHIDLHINMHLHTLLYTHTHVYIYTDITFSSAQKVDLKAFQCPFCAVQVQLPAF